ncbi:MAG: AAA family ATPase [Bacteriovoracaceae bacterium]|nr:AAA family ATPase [Bacteriovoracaceae bacterium]
MSRILLNELQIRNFATIVNEQITFLPALNCIVGETGSGKSLILDALQLVFGGRADKKIIRKGSDSAVVEAIFTTKDPEIHEYFNNLGFPFEDDQIVVKRIISKDNSRSFLNFQSCPNSILTNFSKRFVDLVGQFDNQKLLSPDYQLMLLDDYCGNKELLKIYSIEYSDYKSRLNLLESSKVKLNESQTRMDYIRFQLNEIDKVSPDADDEIELTEKKNLLRSSLENQERLQGTLLELSESDNDILSRLNGLKKSLIGFSSEFDDLLLGSIEKLEVLSYEVSKSLTGFDSVEYEKVTDRLDSYQKLKRKFGGDISFVLKMRSDLNDELEDLSTLELKISQLEVEISSYKASLHQKAELLHKNRLAGSTQLASEITQKIQSLNMKGASVKLVINNLETLTSTGVTSLTFLAETNAGEGHHEFKEIASGGELSRMLLSLRTILSSKDSISIFLFDEIDTGIGGKTAKLVGKALDEVSENGQVIAITHLPQIANFSKNLIHVNKMFTDSNNRTTTKILGISKKNDRESFVTSMADFK